MSINIKIRLCTSVLCTQLVLFNVCTIGIINPIQNPMFKRCAISVRLSKKIYDMLQVLQVKWYA